MNQELFYGFKDQERLDCDPDDTVIKFFESLSDIEDIKYPLEILEYEKEKMWEQNNIEKYANDILADLLEVLDDKYGDPDSYGFDATENMKKASLELARVMVKDYYVFSCVPTGNIITYTKEQAEKLK